MPKAWGFAWIVLLAGAGPVYAHSPVPGIEGFYVGLLHPFSTPAQALLLIGLGFVVGAFDVGKAGWLLGAFLIASIAGLIVGLADEQIDTTMFAVAFFACSLTALVPGKIVPIALAIITFGGFLIGGASIPDDGPTRDRLFTMSGSIVGANIGLLYLFGIIHWARGRYTWACGTPMRRMRRTHVGEIYQKGTHFLRVRTQKTLWPDAQPVQCVRTRLTNEKSS